MDESKCIQTAVLIGTIHSEGSLIGHLVMPVGYNCYSGACEVIPKTKAQVLETCDKLMTKNVTVQAIPYYEVENPQGGNTIIIGGDNYGDVDK